MVPYYFFLPDASFPDEFISGGLIPSGISEVVCLYLLLVCVDEIVLAEWKGPSNI